MLKNIVIGLLSVFLFVSVAGCKTTPTIPPTHQELQAANTYKKSIAIIEFDEDGSKVHQLSQYAMTHLEPLLVGHFKLVERSKIQHLINQYDLVDVNQIDALKKVGELSGVDYFVFGNISTTVMGPTIDHSSSKNKDGKFTGSIWEEVVVRTEVALKIVDTKTGLIHYTDQKRASTSRNMNQQSFSDEKTFKKTLQVREIANIAINVVEMLSDLDRDYYSLVTKTVADSVEKFEKSVKRSFPHTGEVIDFLSEKEVVVNLGSAYGLRSGTQLLVFDSDYPIADPKTGLITIPKKKKAKLKVKEVTSGLSCIAKGSKKSIAKLRLGDKVITY